MTALSAPDGVSIEKIFRKGAQRDLVDRRCDALKSLCNELRIMKNHPEYIMVENVRGFETSAARQLLVETLQDVGYYLEVRFVHNSVARELVKIEEVLVEVEAALFEGILYVVY